METLIELLLKNSAGQFASGAAFVIMMIYVIIRLYKELFTQKNKPSDQIVREIITPEFMAVFLEKAIEIPLDGKTLKRRGQELQHDVKDLAQKDSGIIDVLKHVEKSITDKMDEHYPKQTKALNGLSEEIDSLSEEITFLRKKIV